jgi:hypothetical protein
MTTFVSQKLAAGLFPQGDYTPYGYLQNPYHVARSYQDTTGGNIRTPQDLVGIGWVYPTERVQYQEAALGFGLTVDGQTILTRDQFLKTGYVSRYHSAQILTYNTAFAGVEIHITHWLGDADSLVQVVELKNESDTVHDGTAYICAQNRTTPRKPGEVSLTINNGKMCLEGPDAPHHYIQLAPLKQNWRLGNPLFAPTVEELVENPQSENELVLTPAVVGALPLHFRLQPGESISLIAALQRSDTPITEERVQAWLNSLDDKIAADNAFYRNFPKLRGDWPQHWIHGFLYDLETTRLCTFPAGGVFQDVWPTWMQAYPRAVLAEGTMDMMRLSYADPDMAKRAVLSLFRDTPDSNVPCVHQGGEYNMVASDGSTCGTSPAWCLPMHNIYCLYLRTLDKQWVADLYPYLTDYVEWWLEHRTDEEGWAVYKCTWEAGEDNTPRLDPDETGDHVISGVTRPVELQASMAQACILLAEFAQQLGKPDQEKWQNYAADFIEKTRALWDPEENRFRDWDKRHNCFLDYKSVGEDYWGGNPVRYSSLSLIPVLMNVASPEQIAAVQQEVALYGRVPITIWPSWTFVVAECASAVGLHEFVSHMSYGIIDRVYAENDRRSQHDYVRPTPGGAREYWPEDVTTFKGSDAYAWGAQTATLLIRQIVGVQDAEETADYVFNLIPALPEKFLVPGSTYGISNFLYRGKHLNINYTVGSDRKLTLELVCPKPACVEIRYADGTIYASSQPQAVHVVSLDNYQKYQIKLIER